MKWERKEVLDHFWTVETMQCGIEIVLWFVDIAAADAEELRGHLVGLGQCHHRRRRIRHVRHGHALALGPRAGDEVNVTG